MSDTAKNTRSSATTTAKCFTIKKARQDILRVVIRALGALVPDDQTEIEAEVELLAEGGYNAIWLVSFAPQYGNDLKFILREPTDHALLPHQIENEIAFLTYIAKNHPSIPVPKVYSYNIGSSSGSVPFIAMQFIRGRPLSEAWRSYDESQKDSIVHQLADMIIAMGETRFNGIGGLTLSHALGPTVEGPKLFKGRDKFHSPDHYDIGPYPSTQAYVLACYTREIQYYTHAPLTDIDMDLFDTVPKNDFITSLQSTHNHVLASPHLFHPEEPFVLNHGDFNGRNILMHANGTIAAVIDWEFAGTYPLSELLDGTGVDVLEMESEEDVEENWRFGDRVMGLVEGKARERGWGEWEVELLCRRKNEALQRARVEMVPDCFGDGGEGGGEVEGGEG